MKEIKKKQVKKFMNSVEMNFSRWRTCSAIEREQQKKIWERLAYWNGEFQVDLVFKPCYGVIAYNFAMHTHAFISCAQQRSIGASYAKCV